MAIQYINIIEIVYILVQYHIFNMIWYNGALLLEINMKMILECPAQKILLFKNIKISWFGVNRLKENYQEKRFFLVFE